MQLITSADNQYIKLLRAVREPKGRQRRGCYLVEGLRVGEEALAAGIPLRQALFSSEALLHPRVESLAIALEEAGCPVAQVPGALLEKVTDTAHSQGVAILAELPDLPEAALSWPVQSQGCYACLDRLADPGNLGTIIRSAYAAGVQGLLLSGAGADPYNPKTVRSAMGSLFRLPLAKFSRMEDTYAALQRLGAKVLVTAADGQDVRSLGPVLQGCHCWVLGSEAEGVHSRWREKADYVVSLPMVPGAESLNVAAAAAVLFYQSLFAVR